VLKIDRIRDIVEKPSHEYSISAGIYCVNDAELAHVSDARFFTVPQLIHALLGAGRKVGAHHIAECCIGLEHIGHFEEAVKELSKAPLSHSVTRLNP
jgi:hypothetical protein